MKYVAYYRVSTSKQAKSNLGLEAQKAIVEKQAGDGMIVAEFTDVESGTRKGNNRPELKNAIERAKEEKAKLIIAKLDRLARNVLFTAMLMESGVDFVACDMPTANKFTIHIFAALAEQEADLISQRTKAALVELKKKGRKLGSPENLTMDAIRKGQEARKRNAKENENNRKASALIVSLRNEGKSFYQIVKMLNENGYRTRTGKPFHQIQAIRLYDRYCTENQ